MNTPQYNLKFISLKILDTIGETKGRRYKSNKF